MNNPLDKQDQGELIECTQSSTLPKWWSDCEINSRELFEIINREVHYEHNLISNRMTWYVTSQSFLMAAFAVSGGNGHQFIWLAKPLIPILGIVTSLVIWLSLIAAVEAMHRLKDYKNRIFRQDKYLQKLDPFNLRFRKKTENWFKFTIRVGWIHYIGLSPPVVIPPTFLIAWIIALLQVYK
jgi:hypothetical protein